MKQGYYGKIEAPREAIYEAACALDNQDVLGRAAIAGVSETGNPKHAWDFLVAAPRAA